MLPTPGTGRLVENDPDAIGRYMADDWPIIGSDGSVGDKPTFLGLVRSGALSHDVMESDDLSVRIYRPGKDVSLAGGAKAAQQCLNAGLVDEQAGWIQRSWPLRSRGRPGLSDPLDPHPPEERHAAHYGLHPPPLSRSKRSL